MLRTLNREAVAGFSSTFSLANLTRPAISAASSSSTGAINRHGPHHGAQRSRSTGTGERSTSAANVASVTVTGAPEAGKGVLHLPQIGVSPGCAPLRREPVGGPASGQLSIVIVAMAALPSPRAARGSSAPTREHVGRLPISARDPRRGGRLR